MPQPRISNGGFIVHHYTSFAHRHVSASRQFNSLKPRSPTLTVGRRLSDAVHMLHINQILYPFHSLLQCLENGRVRPSVL